MRTSAAGRAAIIQREGCKLRAYRDSVGIWTIGVGHTGRAAPPVVTEGMTITNAEADEILSRDLVPFEAAVNGATTRAMSQNAFDACVSLAFNIGEGAFKGSRVARLMRAGDMQGAADAFMLWDKAGGHVIPGLQTRRAAERAQFLKPGFQASTFSRDAPPIARVPPPLGPKPSPKAKTAAGIVVVGAAVTAVPAVASNTGWLVWAALASGVVAAVVFLVLHLRKG